MKNSSKAPCTSISNPIEDNQSAHQFTIKNALEKLLNNIPDEPMETLGDLISDKAKSLKSTVNELLDEIEQRKGLDYKFLKKIDDTICKENTVLMNLEKHQNQYEFEKRMEIKKLEKKFDDSVLDLEKEKREEDLECWRDLMSLKRYLMSAFRDYWDFVRKREMLKG